MWERCDLLAWGEVKRTPVGMFRKTWDYEGGGVDGLRFFITDPQGRKHGPFENESDAEDFTQLEQVMATEQEYDEIIAPLLAEVAERCKDLGMSITARVEWEPGECGITNIGISPKSGIGQRMAFYAVMSRGNLDGMVMAMRRDGIDMSQSIFGSMFDRES